MAESGTVVADVCRHTGIARAMFYAWKKKCASRAWVSVCSIRTPVRMAKSLRGIKTRRCVRKGNSLGYGIAFGFLRLGFSRCDSMVSAKW
ncbi:transposase [Dyella terrae]|uniref:transposase n=1 Tax=Dyella terrae TaxID=522259 RepID=UPI003D18E196